MTKINRSNKKLEIYIKMVNKHKNELSMNALDTCLTAQDKFKKYLDYFRIDYV